MRKILNKGLGVRGVLGTSAALTALSIAGGAFAQEMQIADAGDITVTATRTQQETFDVPATVSVMTSADIESILATDIKDLVRFEPGVSVRNSPSRFTAAFSNTGRDGNAGFNIRGLEGNRVLFMVDGVRVPDGFSFGPAAFGRGDYVDLDLLERVEILRGPGSALYGSDGVAGVVSFTTKDPDDVLGDENFAGRVRAAYSSADESWAEGVSAAGRWGAWSALAAYTRREGHEQENQGADSSATVLRTAANPQDTESNAAMLRAVFQPSETHRFRLTVDYGDRDTYTDALSARAIPPLAASSVLDLWGTDESEHTRYGFDYFYENQGGLIDRGSFSVYHQTASAAQFSFEDRNTSPDRTRLTTFDNDVWGVAGQLESEFSTGSARHLITYGGDYSVTTQEGVRDGAVPPAGETFPTRPFPNTEYMLAGLFVQDEISFMDGRVVFYPSLRYDAYDLDPTADAFYTLPVAGQQDSRVTPRIGVVVWPTETFGVFFNYAQGFKAPAPGQVNNNFANPLQGYTSIPNPDLKPETSEGAELGIRFRHIESAGAEWRASGAAFMATYDDFIEQVQVGGTFAPLDPAVFQYVNLTEADIWGLEGRVTGVWDNGFGIDLAVSFAEGEYTSGAGTLPLESVDPLKLVAGLSYGAPSGAWGGQFIVTHVAQKDRDDTTAPFIPGAFTILDITGYWNITESATLRVGLFNVTDEKYWWWSDVRGVGSLVDAYTQPGANFSASIAYRF